ncbi:methyltransferase domain-containing protein [Arthrobacter sp. MSA 4-2]|uniref:class I SAM-dependent methyltransferase n=1 Tax=Arthrobacter sp. MSA 4-2 TaxID=2794349 RepID=UPI0018E76B46|nr:class I SAM-dependent methyltransferase [Arthrobacter sp. MSA 4-2]MBJ2122221.1 methyltransferase domain-containing protein [Arthrobacter sp. MSA 4-2]
MTPGGFLLRRDAGAVEEMDKPDCDPLTLERTYSQFGLVNAVVAGWRHTYRTLVRPQLSPNRENTLLDIGSGGGDVPRALARWARRDGLALTITAIDPDGRAHAYATSRPGVPGLSFRRALSSELVAEGRRFTVVTSNHVLHHLDPGALAGLLDDSGRLAERLAVHSDIARSRIGYGLFSVGTLPLRGSYIRRDGLTSIRRSYTPAELREVLAADRRPGWSVESAVPFRNHLVFRAGTDA